MNANQTSAIDRDTASVVKEAQNLMKAIEVQGEAAISEAGTQARDALASARRNLGDLQQSAVDTAKSAATTADDYVRSNPWQSVGIGAAIGALAGFLIARR